MSKESEVTKMAEKEMLQLIISTLESIDEKVNTIDEKVSSIENRLTTLEAEQKKTNIRLDTLESEQKAVTKSLVALGTKVKALETAQAKVVVTLDALEADVNKLQLTTENTVDKCIQVLYEAHTLNADRFDKINFDNIEHNYKLSAMTAKLAYDGVQELTKRFDEFIKTA